MTSANPYSPPQADVRDTRPARLLAERPRQISRAFVLVWISLALGVGASVLELRRGPDSVTAWLVGVIVAVTVSIVLNLAIWRGRNWARIVYMVLTALVLVAYPFLLATEAGLGRFEIALDVTAMALDCFILYLLFTRPGSQWFRFASDRAVSQ
jgi:hypothetical protein